MWHLVGLLLVIVGAFMFGYGWRDGQQSEAYGALFWLIVGAVVGLIGVGLNIGFYLAGGA